MNLKPWTHSVTPLKDISIILIARIYMIIKLFLLIFMIGVPLFGDYYISQGKQHKLYPIKDSRALTNKGIRYFANAQGIKFGVKDTIIVCYKDATPDLELEKKYSLILQKQISPTMYLYKVADNKKTLSIANKINQEKNIKFAHPNFIIKKEERIADDYYKDQWHLHNNDGGADIDVEKAWKYTKGDGIVTGIIDEGIDIDHKDLRENVIGSANFNDPNSDYPGTKTGNWHGTACAGLLCAAENGVGIVGVAPHAKLVAVRYSDNSIANDISAFMFMMKNDVSVITNSWGSYSNLDAYSEIFKTLATKGRDGKGILIFFAAGNDKKNLDAPDINDESESPYVISVGSSTEYDKIASYNNYGSSLDFLAPGGISGGELITTDATGKKGYTDWNYNFNFIGTSASAPIAAGVGALMLSANPDLTRDEVIDILQKTSKKIGDYEYINGRNDHAGYGRIDAGKAVEMAKYYHQSQKSFSSNLSNFAHLMFNYIQQ